MCTASAGTTAPLQDFMCDDNAGTLIVISCGMALHVDLGSKGSILPVLAAADQMALVMGTDHYTHNSPEAPDMQLRVDDVAVAQRHSADAGWLPG